MLEPSSLGTPIRAVFLDVDGTLLGSEERISPSVLNALDAARAQGCEVVICTGRSRFTAQPIAEQIGPPLGYVVASNGGVVMHLESGAVLHRRLLPISVALEVARTLVECGTEPYVYEDATGDGWEAARVLYHPDLPTSPFAVPPRYCPHAKLLDALPFAPVSVNAYGPPEKMRALVRYLSGRLPAEVDIIQSGSIHAWGIEVFAAGVSKRTGLEAVAAHLGLRREEIMAVGDHFNDLEMIEWAGIGVAMGNAVPEVIAAADHVTATVAEDGVARAVERFVLRGTAKPASAPLRPNSQEVGKTRVREGEQTQ